MSAQMVAFTHQQSTGQPITVDTLAERLGVNHTTARQLHAGITNGAKPPARINGHDPVEATQ